MRKRSDLPGELNGRGDAHMEAVDGYFAVLRACLRDARPAQIAAVAARLSHVVRSGGQIFLAGNGGSAATASHMALDLGKGTLGRPPRTQGPRVRAVALNDPGATVTAWANDHGYDRVFAEQIATHGRCGDAVLFFSVSGNSPNVVAAARTAKNMGITVIALLGHPGGRMRDLADLAIVVPSADYGVVEDVHLAINHAVTRALTHALVDAAPPPDAGPRGSRRVLHSPMARARHAAKRRT